MSSGRHGRHLYPTRDMVIDRNSEETKEEKRNCVDGGNCRRDRFVRSKLRDENEVRTARKKKNLIFCCLFELVFNRAKNETGLLLHVQHESWRQR